MGFQPRIPISFTTPDGSTSVFTFPVTEFEFQSDQGLYLSSVPVVGANYPFDQLGTSRPIKQAAREQLRFMVYESDPATVDSDIDAMLSKLVSIGQGKLTTQDKNGVVRWAYARVLNMPMIQWRAGDIYSKACSLEYQRLSDWYGATNYNTDFSINTDPKSITIVNAGNERIYNAVLTLKGAPTVAITSISVASPTQIVTTTPHGLATGDSVLIAGTSTTPTTNGTFTATVINATTFTVPVNVTIGGGAVGTVQKTWAGPTAILNTTNGYQIQTSRAGPAANNWLKIDAGAHSVKYSINSGVTYAGDFDLVTLPGLQRQLMVLDAGNNAFTVTGANGSTLHVDHYPAYA